jgi:hypothetical protein
MFLKYREIPLNAKQFLLYPKPDLAEIFQSIRDSLAFIDGFGSLSTLKFMAT